MAQASNIDTSKLEALIEQKDFVEAKKMIDAVIDQDLSKEERGRTYVHLAKIYLHLTNKINEEYLHDLNETIDLAKKVTRSQKDSDKAIKTAEIKQSLEQDSK